MSCVLVTGASGFIGSHILHDFVHHGWKAIAYSTFTSGYKAIEDIMDRVSVIRGDVSDPVGVMEALRKHDVDCIVHCASLLTAASQRRPREAFKVNVVGTLNVLEGARVFDIKRVVYLSSTAVYGYTREGEIVAEDHPKNPVTIYGATKLFSEHLGFNYFRDYGIEFVALRFPIVYGPWQSRRGFSSFKEIIEGPVEGRPVRIKEGGDQKYEAVYVLDVAHSAYLAAIREGVGGEAFNIGSGEMCSLHELAEIVREIIPEADVEVGPGYDIAEPVRGPLDLSKARAKLGYEPKYSIKMGVRDYIDYLLGRKRLEYH